MGNVDSIIKGHNLKMKEAEKNEKVKNSRKCNCRKKSDCPLNGNCLIESVVYEGLLTELDGPNAGTQLSYSGSTSNTFKSRYNSHKSTLNHENSKSHTTLSEHHHKLNRKGIKHKIEWRIVKEAKAFDGMKCNLCVEEKLHIAYKKSKSLNSRDELLYKCRHMKKFAFETKKNAAAFANGSVQNKSCDDRDEKAIATKTLKILKHSDE